eukprot:3364998-Pyramimonas_sp.AAC.1
MECEHAHTNADAGASKHLGPGKSLETLSADHVISAAKAHLPTSIDSEGGRGRRQGRGGRRCAKRKWADALDGARRNARSGQTTSWAKFKAEAWAKSRQAAMNFRSINDPAFLRYACDRWRQLPVEGRRRFRLAAQSHNAQRRAPGRRRRLAAAAGPVGPGRPRLSGAWGTGDEKDMLTVYDIVTGLQHGFNRSTAVTAFQERRHHVSGSPETERVLLQNAAEFKVPCCKLGYCQQAVGDRFSDMASIHSDMQRVMIEECGKEKVANNGVLLYLFAVGRAATEGATHAFAS